MIWEDFRNVDSSQHLGNHNLWLQTTVRHLRHTLRVRSLFGPEIPDDKLLSAFGGWDENITRTLRNINCVIAAAQRVAGVAEALPPA